MKKMEEGQCLPERRTYNILISLHAKHDDIKMETCYFAKMKVACLEPNLVSYRTLLYAYLIRQMVSEAEDIIQEMDERHLEIDEYAQSALTIIADLPHVAKSYLKKMQEAGLMIQYKVEPDVVVYGVLINAFADLGSVKEATGYVNAMKNAGQPENAVIYNSLIKLYTKVDYLKEAQEVISCQDSTLINGRFEEATHIARQMGELGLLTDLLSYNNVLGLYFMDGRIREVVRIFKEMVSACIQPDDSTFKSLGSVLLKCGLPKWDVNKLQVTRKKDAQSGFRAWMDNLSSVVGMDEGDDDDCLELSLCN
ncbi:hypothetical protein CRYUN_Cryun18bG0034400 [Craigia yunnanensis]